METCCDGSRLLRTPTYKRRYEAYEPPSKVVEEPLDPDRLAAATHTQDPH